MQATCLEWNQNNFPILAKINQTEKFENFLDASRKEASSTWRVEIKYISERHKKMYIKLLMYKRHEREKYKMADYVIYFIHISQAKLFFLARSCRKWKFREIYAFKSKFMVSMYVAFVGWVNETVFIPFCFCRGGRQKSNKVEQKNQWIYVLWVCFVKFSETLKAAENNKWIFIQLSHQLRGLKDFDY